MKVSNLDWEMHLNREIYKTLRIEGFSFAEMGSEEEAEDEDEEESEEEDDLANMGEVREY